jgi:HD superfamily phosphohydrolase
VGEPVLIELIESPAFERLKHIHQYGIAYYTTHKEEYTRYKHSLGVFAVLRMKGASLEEQIAGLLHDVSHTVFSHVGDWIFQKVGSEKDYQNDIHEEFLEKYGLGAILKKYNLSSKDVLPLEHLFPMLEQKKPNLCADRIDYNIQGAYYQGQLSLEEARELLNDLEFEEGKWVVSSRKDLALKIARFALFMSEDCWGSRINHMTSTWLSEAILRALDLKKLKLEDIHFGLDDAIWTLLIEIQDSVIQELMKKVLNPSNYSLPSGTFAPAKFSGIDPWIKDKNTLVRLTELDSDYCQEYEALKARMQKGHIF